MTKMSLFVWLSRSSHELMGRLGALGRHNPVAAPLRPADDTGQSVERQQAEQEPHHWGAGSAGLIR